MKKTAIVPVTAHYNIEVEKMIKTKDAVLKETAQINARHKAKDNLPAPDESGILPVITEDLRAGYEELIASIYQSLQPEAHLPEAQMDGALADDQNKNYDNEIKKRIDQIHNKERELGNKKSVNLKKRIQNAIFFTVLICIGEIIFNTMSFQTMGDNLIFSFILSLSVTLAVFALAHFAATQIKNTENRNKKIATGVCALLIALTVFIVLAILRSDYMAKNDVLTNPVIFVVLNLILFIATAVISYQLMPSKKEIKENRGIEKIYGDIKKLKKEIEIIKQKKEDNNKELIEKNIQRTRLAFYVNYTVERTKKKYNEAIAIYKSENINTRTDGKIPVCFTEETAPIEVNNAVLHYQFIKEK